MTVPNSGLPIVIDLWNQPMSLVCQRANGQRIEYYFFNKQTSIPTTRSIKNIQFGQNDRFLLIFNEEIVSKNVISDARMRIDSSGILDVTLRVADHCKLTLELNSGGLTRTFDVDELSK